MKIQNLFVKSIVDQDSDERLTDSNLIGTPQNISIHQTVGNNRGVLKNVPGNSKLTNLNISGAETIGKGKDESSENIYNFIKGTQYDYVIEYNTITNTSDVVLQSSTNGVLNFRSGERITNFNLFVNSETGDKIIAWSGDSNPPRIVNVTTAKTWAIDGFTNDEISVMKPSPIFAPTISLTTSIDGVENNFIEDKMLCFATRWKTKDGYYTAPSSWSKIAFTPKAFALDYQTYDNNGMLNLSNAVNIGFNVGPRDVVQVDLLFRESNSQTVYVVQQFIKAEENWGDNTSQTFQFSKSKIYTVLSEDQFFRNYDNVPLSAKCQTAIGSRIAYANYLEGRDLGVEVDFSVDYITKDSFLSEIIGTITTMVDSVDYSNVSDIEDSQNLGGSAPLDQMNYTTNTLEMNLSANSSLEGAFSFTISPLAQYITVPYDVTLKDGATVIGSWTNQVGSNVFLDTFSSDHNLQVFVTSDEGLIYDMDMRYDMAGVGGYKSRYKYLANHQLIYPKAGGYDSTLVGDTIIEHIGRYDTTGYVFSQGNQIRILFDLFSSLEANRTQTVEFLYILTQDYTDLAEFLNPANSDFVYQLETVFSSYFQGLLTLSGTLVSYEGFKVSSTGATLKVTMPKLVCTVSEPVGTQNKDEFYLVQETNLTTLNENAYASLHSNRDYEVGLIYMDLQGRKQTVITSPNNSVYIPTENSDKVTQLQVTIDSNPPSWAKYYKFAIKQTKKSYETIYANVVYKDGIYRWIKLVAENKDKVKEGNTIILKSDYSGPLNNLRKVKVLEIATKPENFITGNLNADGNEIVEEAGTYMKIKQGDFDINIDGESYRTYKGNGSGGIAVTEPIFGHYDATPTFIPYEIKAGTLISFNSITKGIMTQILKSFSIQTTAQSDYPTIKEWFDAEVEPTDAWNNYVADGSIASYGFDVDVKQFFIETDTSSFIINITFDIKYSGGTLVFETEPIEQLQSSFFETPTVYTINNGNHQYTTHTLTDAFNCFAFGNGVESFKIQDGLTKKSFSIDSNPNDVNKDGYKQINRYADITYSEVYESSTNVNRLNEFNLYLANYKNDIQKDWGPITVMKGFDTNLDIIQEDKYSIVYYGKDLLYNADGTTNLAGIPQVLGQQKAMDGEFGCQHIDSFDFYGFNRYFADVKRGVVLKKANNGIFEISNQLMRSYFKRLFRDNTINQINGEYDQFNDVYIINIQYNGDSFVTWLYSDIANGWLGTQTFNPEDMSRVNGVFYSFKNGEIYLHNDEDNYNTFYGTLYPSYFEFNFSQSPSQRKIFKTLEIEGSHAWQITADTNLNSGYVNESDFELKEDFFYGYIRGTNNQEDTSLLNFQGIGNATANGLVLNFGFDLDPIISVGDSIVNSNLQLVGTILSKTANSLTLNTVNNFTNGNFVLCKKSESVQNQGVLGYYMKVTATVTTNEPIEIFAINSEVSISNPI